MGGGLPVHDIADAEGSEVVRDWANQVRDFICETLFRSLSFIGKGDVR